MERMIRHTGFHRRRAGVHNRQSWVPFLLIFAALFFLVSCAGPPIQKSPAKGVYHIVKKGETVYRIARIYSVSPKKLVEVNNISDITNIKEGSIIFIPDANQVIDDATVSSRKSETKARKTSGLKDRKLPDRVKPSKPADLGRLEEKTPLEKPGSSQPIVPLADAAPAKPVAEQTASGTEEVTPTLEKQDEVKTEKDKLFWPVRGTVKTRFGIQPNKTYHNWIKITCPAGTQVRSAAAGTVIFSASLKDFGETIIIRHSNGFATVYTHLKKRHVKADQSVKKGEVIALAGEMDETGAVYINFEIRHKGKAQNPLLYMP